MSTLLSIFVGAVLIMLVCGFLVKKLREKLAIFQENFKEMLKGKTVTVDPAIKNHRGVLNRKKTIKTLPNGTVIETYEECQDVSWEIR